MVITCLLAWINSICTVYLQRQFYEAQGHVQRDFLQQNQANCFFRFTSNSKPAEGNYTSTRRHPSYAYTRPYLMPV